MSTSVRYFKGRLFIDGAAAETVAARFGTPVYVYAAREIRRRFRALDAAFKSRNHLICYALKANSNLSVCRILAKEGSGADVVSGGELKRALLAGFDSRRIVLSGVGKTEAEIEAALKARILALNVESEEELDAVARVARRLRRIAPVSIRVNPNVDAHTHRHITTGRSDNKFGVDRGQVAALYRKVRREPWLRAAGIQCHIGSQITDAAPYAKALNVLLAILRDLSREGMELDFVDIGGGMGITYDRETPLSLTALAAKIERALAPWPKVRLIIEPGRFLTADAGVLLTRVLYRKQTGSTRFVVVDAAMNDLMRPALYGAHHPIRPARRGGRAVRMDVVGPVCETADCFAKARLLPPPNAGDIWAILKAGAYGFSMSSQYNSRPRAAEIMVEGKSCRVIRRRETMDDLLRLESISA